MQKISLAKNLSFSRIIHGLWRLDEWKQPKEETLQLIQFCLDNGITTFDHADIYGSYTCEKLFGDALSLQPSLRSHMQLVTKCGIILPSAQRPQNATHHYNTSKEHILFSVEQSLKNFRTDYIDLLLIHRPDPFMDPAEVAEAFQELHSAGKVLHFGVSNFKQDHFEMLASYVKQPLVTNQLELSAYQLENFQDGTLQLCMKHRIAPMAWSPLSGGDIFASNEEKAVRLRHTLTKVQEEIGANGMDEVLYAWLLVHPANIMPIVGSGKRQRIQAAIRATELSLTRDQWFAILHASMGHDVP
ncbi:aldo/keto reductase [Shimazuella kribbensis]|uniref:aldo/keto reductase n=1 Tax=Shimazuella kribbensis TaxID=139808 RepID=UPI00041ED190|nr:aldo/keto reductase [Shimazuella kribbensis]